jgi:hypothetical protein
MATGESGCKGQALIPASRQNALATALESRRARAARHVGVTRVTRATRAARYPDAGPWALDAALGPFFPRLAQPSGWAFLCAAQRGHSTNAK